MKEGEHTDYLILIVRNVLIVSAVLALFSYLIIVAYKGSNFVQTIQDNSNDLNLTQTIDLIEKNCGSTHLTKKFKDDRWYVFKNVCLHNGYCKYDYVLLSDCMGVNNG